MRPISISLSPNTKKDDFLIALKTLALPTSWSGKNITNLESKFAKMFGNNYNAFAVNSGRSAEYVILKSLGIGPGDEVLVQAFTCIAVPNSIKWLGAKPVFVDIDDTFNMDPADLGKKITKNTKAVIIQHTFGVPAQLEKIIGITKKHKLYLVEDCAHALGAKYEDKLLGTYSTASFFSFGRDKVISSVFGGMILTNDITVSNKINEVVDKLPKPSPMFTTQQLMHPILFNSLILPFYHFGFGKISLGKILLFAFQKLKILSKPVYKEELLGKQISLFPQKASAPLSMLATHQLNKLDMYNKHRKEIAQYYFKNLKAKAITLPKENKNAIWLRFPIRVDDPKKLLAYFKARKVLLGNWYANVIDPKCNLANIGYSVSDCPNAIRLSNVVVNLPTYPNLTKKQAGEIVKIINDAI